MGPDHEPPRKASEQVAPARADRDELHDAIRRAADEAGHKELLFALDDESRTTLAKRLNGLEGRQPTAAMVLELCRMQQSSRLLATLCRLCGYAPPKRMSDESAAEKLQRLTDEVRSRFGKAGEETLREVLGRQA
jgi:hypothetical protein